MAAAWFADAGYIAANADTIQRFARALHEAAVYANADQTETAPLLAEAMKIDLSTVLHSTRLTFGESLTGPDLQPIIDASARYGVIEKAFPGQELISRAVR